MAILGTAPAGAEWLTPAEVAKRLRVSAETIRVMCRAGEIPAARIRNQYRIHVDDLAAYLAAHRAAVGTNGKEVRGSVGVDGSDGPSATAANR